jgi:hypothetical protein
MLVAGILFFSVSSMNSIEDNYGVPLFLEMIVLLMLPNADKENEAKCSNFVVKLHNNNNVIDKPCAQHDKPKIVMMRLEACQMWPT